MGRRGPPKRLREQDPNDTAPLAKLVFQICEHMKLPPYAAGDSGPCAIPVPPMGSDLMLGPLPLNEYVRPKPISTLDACGVFNEFAYNFLGKEPQVDDTPGRWLAEAGGIPNKDAWLVTRPTNPLYAIATYLYLLHISGLPMDLDGGKLIIDTDDGQIGFNDGLVISPVAEVCYEVPRVEWGAAIQKSLAGRVGRCHHAAFNRLWVAAHRNKLHRDPLLLALAIVYWRSPTPKDAARWFYNI